MNKKLYIAVAVVAGVFIILVVLFKLTLNGGGQTTKLPENDAAIEKRVTWNQQELSVTAFSTREDPEGQLLEDKQAVHIVFTSFFNFSVTPDSKVKSMTITRVKFTQGVGKQVFIHPPHKAIASSRSYTYEPDMARLWAKDIVDGGKVYTLKVVNEAPKFYDEVLNIGGFPNFALITKDIGTLSEQSILNKDKIYSTDKLLQYLNVTAEKLDGEIILDVKITFEDGKKYTKRLSGKIEGEKALKDPFYLIKMQEL